MHLLKEYKISRSKKKQQKQVIKALLTHMLYIIKF